MVPHISLSFDRLYRYRMILIVDRCFYLIALFDLPDHIGTLVGVQTNFCAVLDFDKIIGVVDSEQFTVDGFPAPWQGTVFTGVSLLVIIGLKIVLLRVRYGVGFHRV